MSPSLHQLIERAALSRRDALSRLLFQRLHASLKRTNHFLKIAKHDARPILTGLDRCLSRAQLLQVLQRRINAVEIPQVFDLAAWPFRKSSKLSERRLDSAD